MRTLLTTIAVLVIVALTGALVIPSLIDWTRHRGLIETQLSHLLGDRVRIDGAATLRLLPSPRLEVRQMAIGAQAEGDAPLAIAGLRAELAVGPLLRGEIQLTELSLDGPKLQLVRDADGAIRWPLDSRGHLPLRIDRLAVQGGSVSIADTRSGGRFDAKDVVLTADVSALTGPFHGNGRLRVEQGPVKFRFSAAAVSAGRMPFKLVLDETAAVPRVELDGVFAPSSAPDAMPVFRGRGDFTVTGYAPLPWKLSGDLDLGAGHARLANADLHVGDDRRFATATGSFDLSLGATAAARVTLTAKNLDVDRQFGGKEGVVSPRQALARLRQVFDDAGTSHVPRLPLTVDFKVGLLSLGGDVLTDTSGNLAFTPGQPLTGRLSANGPGDSRIALDGTFDVGVAPRFQGRIDLAAGHWPRFAAWAVHDDAALVDAVRTYAPFETVRIGSSAQISGVGFALQDLSASVDRSTFAGTLAFTAPVGSERARLSAYLTSQILDIDHLPDLGPMATERSDLDLALDITARTARIADLGNARLDAAGLELKLERTAGTTALERLRIEGLNGASLEAHGRIDPQGGRFEGHLEAPELSGIAALAQRFVDARWGAALRARAAALSPAKLDVRLRAGADGMPEMIAVSGHAAGTELDVSFDRRSAATSEVEVAVKLSAEDGGRLLRQLGLPGAGSLATRGRARIALAATGSPQDSLRASATAELAGTKLSWQGRFDPAEGAFRGPASFAGNDVAPLLRTLGLAGASAPALAVNATGDIDVRSNRAALHRLAGIVAGTKVDGHLDLTFGSSAGSPSFTGQRARVTGDLSIDRLSLASLAALKFGPAPREVDGSWSPQRFAPVPAALPDTRLTLRIAALDIERSVARNVSLGMDLAPGQLKLQLEPSAFRGGTLGGRATLRRGAGIGSVEGHLDFTGLEILAPFAGGRLSGMLDFAGSGDSPRALVGGFAGQGSMRFRDGQLSRVDLGTVDRVVAAVDAETVPFEPSAIDRLLQRETGRSDLPVASLELPILIAAGKARLGPTSFIAAGANLELSAQFDLAASHIELNEALTMPKAPEEWTGPPPRLTIVWSGPWGAPARRVEAATFFNGLSARALTINLQKLEAFDADIRERAFFNRRLKVIREHEAQERRAAEAVAAEERRRREDEKRRRDEEKRRNDAAQRTEEQRRLQEILRKFDATPASPPAITPPPVPRAPPTAPPVAPPPGG